MSQSIFQQILLSRKVLVVAGSGGVGKTTTSAIAGLAGALLGRRTLILTIDPARRLATSLGIESVGAEPAEITEALRASGLKPKAEVWAMMLDMSNTFDQVLERFVDDPARLTAIRKNVIYRNLTRTLSGSHEYAAMNKLWDLHDSGEWDLIILDTPPTTHALDFLESPRKLENFFHSRIVDMLVRGSGNTRRGLGIFKRGTDLVMAGIERLIGGGLIGQISEFFGLVDTFLAEFDENAGKVEKLLASPDVEFGIVCGPQPSQTREALNFFRALDRIGIQAGVLVINRTMDPVLPGTEDGAQRWAPDSAEGIVEQVDRAASLQVHGRDELARVAGQERVLEVPMREEDVYSIDGLAEVGAILFGKIFARKK